MIMINRSVVFFGWEVLHLPFFGVWSKTRIIKLPILGGIKLDVFFWILDGFAYPKMCCLGGQSNGFWKIGPLCWGKKHVACTFWPKFSKATESAPRQGPRALRSASVIEGDVVMIQRPMEWGMIWESLMFFCYFCCRGLIEFLFFCDSPIRRCDPAYWGAFLSEMAIMTHKGSRFIARTQQWISSNNLT